MWSKSGLRKFLPFGHDRQGVGALHGVRAGLAEHEVGSVPVNAPAFRHGDGVVGPDGGAGGPQCFHEHAARRLSHIVRVRFEGQAPDRDGLAPQIAEVALDLVEQDPFLPIVSPPQTAARMPAS